MIDDNLSGYNDTGVRDKYIWLKKEVNRIKGKKLLEEENLLLDY